MLEEKIQKTKCRIGVLKKMILIRKKTIKISTTEIKSCEDELELQETYTFSGKHDCGVLMETNDRKTEALRLGLDYDTYRKRLLRKCSAFRPHLQSLGYFD